MFDTLTTGFFFTITFSSLMIGGSFTSIHLGQNPVSISILQPDGAKQICLASRIDGEKMNNVIHSKSDLLFIFITSLTSTMIRQVLGMISQFEKSNLVEKLKVARKRKSKLNKSKGIIDRNGNGKCAGKKWLSEKHPELSKMVVNYRKMIDRKTHRSLSYRTISRRLKEEHNLVVSHNTVHRILDDIVLMKREQRNRRRRKRIETV